MNTRTYPSKGTHLQCNRGAPRFKTSFPAKVESEFCAIPAIITNLSSSGLLFECEHQALPLLVPNLVRPNSHLPVEFHIHFHVPTQTHSEVEIHLLCGLIYVRRIKHQTASVGCQYNVFEGESEDNLLAYIDSFGEPC